MKFGTYLNPFSASSLWNSFPLNPVLGTYQIPPPGTGWFPTVAEGAYSVQCFQALPTDPPQTVLGWNGTSVVATGPSCPDIGGSQVVTIPHWPAGVTPATGNDGHCDIYDEANNIIHSFYRLKNVDGQWASGMYAWSSLDGLGFGDPAHFYQGARASGVATSAGLIRTHEAWDGDYMYRHVLCMSLDHTAMKSPYVFPVTSEDSAGSTGYTGQIPMGSLLMLPPSFDTSTIENLDLRKVAETLKVYGSRIVDTNTGTPFIVYVENGTGYHMMPNGWDNVVANDLRTVANALRVATANIFVPGNSVVPANLNLNRISLRGGWFKNTGPTLGVFDSWTQSLIFPPTTVRIEQAQTVKTFARPCPWAPIEAGKTYVLSVKATGGASLAFGFYGSTMTPCIGDGLTAEIIAPADVHYPMLLARSGTGNVVSTVSGTLIEKQ